jgi:hypothetical protein
LLNSLPAAFFGRREKIYLDELVPTIHDFRDGGLDDTCCIESDSGFDSDDDEYQHSPACSFLGSCGDLASPVVEFDNDSNCPEDDIFDDVCNNHDDKTDNDIDKHTNDGDADFDCDDDEHQHLPACSCIGSCGDLASPVVEFLDNDAFDEHTNDNDSKPHDDDGELEIIQDDFCDDTDDNNTTDNDIDKAEMHFRFGEVDDRFAKVELENRVLLRQVGDLQTSLVDIRQNIIDVTQNNFEELVVEPMALETQSCDFDDELEVHGGAMALETQSCDFDDVLEVHSIVALNGSCMDLAATFPFGGTVALGTQSSDFDDELEAHGGSLALETRSCDFDDELEVHSIAPEIQTCDFDDELEAHGGTTALEIQSCDLAAQELLSAASGRTFDMDVINQVLSFNGDLCGCGDIYLSELVIAFCLRLRSHELYGPLRLLPLPASFWQAQASHCICGFAKSLREAIRQPGSLDSMEIFERYVDKAAFHFLEVMHVSARELELC